LIAFKADLVKSVLKDPQTMWLDSIKNKESELGEFCEIVNVTEKEYLLETEVMQLSHVTNFLQVLRDEEYRVSSACNFEWRTVPHDRSIYPREVVKKLTEQNTIPLYEVSKQSQRGKNIGFALPVASFGGVEKVTYQVARVLKSKGWVPHLFIVNTNEVDLPKECHSIFENIFYLDVDCQSNWNKKSSYAGTGLPSMSYEEKNKLVKSLLWLDSLVICHAWQLYPAISELKKFNVKLYSHQHLADISSSGRTLGNPFIALAYEHVLDGVLTCSNKLARWFVSQGVPMSKVIPVANGPGLTIENDDILRSYKAKQDRAVEPLRVMYFGRLDVQKGYDRLLEIYHKTKGYENIEWRVVGKEIISDTQTRELDDVIEPPKFDSKSILECYEWADVLLLPSKYEGLPLVIKEAQLMGVCVIATDVGAVSEAIDNGLTGYVYPEQEYVLNSIEFLKKNALNKKLLDEIQTACHRKHEKILSTWNDSVSLFESHLTS
jgi:glycosyltransferase involved in cell wall biosynthesis